MCVKYTPYFSTGKDSNTPQTASMIAEIPIDAVAHTFWMTALLRSTLDLVTVSGVLRFHAINQPSSLDDNAGQPAKETWAASNRRFGYLHMHADHDYPLYVCMYAWSWKVSAVHVVW